MWKTATSDRDDRGTVQPYSQGAVFASSYLDTAIRTVLLSYIAVLPFKGLLVFERNGFLLLLALLVVWCLLNGRLFYRKSPYDGPLLAFLLWVGLTIPFSSFPEYSVKEYGKLLQWMVVFHAVRAFLEESSYRRFLLYVIGSTTAIAIAHGLSQLNLANPQAVVGPFSAEVWFTTFLVMVIPFGLALVFVGSPSVARGLGILLSVLATVCLLATQSRAGLAALILEFLAVAWLIGTKSARITTGILAGCLVAAIMTSLYVKTSAMPDGDSHLQRSIPVKTGVATIVHRLDIWRFTLSKVAEHWLVGIGYGGQTYLLLYGQESETVEPGHTSVKERGTHNILLYLSLHVGVIGMVLFVWFYLSAIQTTMHEYHAAVDWVSKMVLAGMTGSMMGLFLRLQFDQMFVGSLAIMFWVLLATAIIHYPSLNQPASERSSG